MKKQEVRDMIYDELSSLLAGTGFRLKKSEEGFVAPINGGRQVIGVALYDFHPEFEFALTISIRLDAVEEVFHKFSGSPPKYHSASYTMIVPLEHFTGRRERAKLTSEAEIADAVAALGPVVKDKILPFLEEHSTAKSLANSINHSSNPIDITRHPSRAMHGLVLAQMVGDPEFSNLVKKYLGEIHEYPGSEQEKVKSLAAFLESRASSAR